jgi:hypothetical protein
MARLTSIELADETGTLIGATVHRGRVTVDAFERFDRRAIAGTTGFARALQQARGMLDLPRRTRVVLWDGRAAVHPASSVATQPLTAAGFEIERIVSPCDALAALARTRHPRSDATILWLTINRSHVAIVVMRPGRMLYSRAFAWDSTVGAMGSHAKLLQRYALVAFLSPELRRAIEATTAEGGVVDGIVTCGDLPELRSLAMPLIEELDLEVDTLDSTEGIDAAPSLHASVDDIAPAIRLAVAGAVARAPRPRKSWVSVHTVPLAAAASATALVAAGWWFVGRPIVPRAAPQDLRPATTPRADVNLPAPPPTGSTAPAAHIAETPAAPPSSVSGSALEPLPQVTAILTSEDRRTALIDGRVTKVGDTVGRWKVTAIEPEYVVFMDVSGAELRIRLRPR